MEQILAQVGGSWRCVREEKSNQEHLCQGAGGVNRGQWGHEKVKDVRGVGEG